jgi:CO/xanthine dehydrogenase Mo-binding subunit
LRRSRRGSASGSTGDEGAALTRLAVSRRGLLAGAAAGGGLLIAWALLPRSFDVPLSPGRGEAAFNAWLKIGRDGVVTVAVPQLEMGQGVTTLLPQVVATELGADWRQIAVEPAPASGAYVNLPLAARWAPLWRPTIDAFADEPDDYLLRRWAEDNRFAATAEGTSLAAFETPCREAGAAARAMLAMAAADRWGVDWEECDAQAGFVVHGHRCAPRRRQTRCRSLPIPTNCTSPFRASTCHPKSTAAISSPPTCACPAWSTPQSGTVRSTRPSCRVSRRRRPRTGRASSA